MTNADWSRRSDKELACKDCKRTKNSAEFSYEKGVCSECNAKRWKERGGGFSTLDLQLAMSPTHGGIYAGENLGLDATVRDRGHYDRLVREKARQGIVPKG